MVVPVAVVFILKNLAAGLIGFSATLPFKGIPGNSIDMKALREDIAGIVKDQLIEHEIQKQEGRINAVVEFLKNTYQNEKDNGAKKEICIKF